jgi:two-component system, sporulation sensor kinase D
MNIYKTKAIWKSFLLFSAIAIGVGSLWYTNKLVKKLANEEKKKVELWAKATSLIPKSDIKGESLDFLFSVVQYNETVPVILVDKDTNILMYRNLDTAKVSKPLYLENTLERMMEENPPIEIPYLPNRKQYLYYSRSIILSQLIYYPFIQLGVILLFILVAYFAFSSSRKAEQNKVWVGLSKETAHQLGTPISSLLAWVEILRQQQNDTGLIDELQKDVKRLSKITDRFSKIGSVPVKTKNNILEIISSALEYLKTRSSDKIKFSLVSDKTEVMVPVNPPLFEWVIENVSKNAMDAIEGEGEISIRVRDDEFNVYIDIADNGKGIPKSKYKTIFKPGFTTKERGWGLGLSLTKRIVEEYHKGKIFVLGSELGKGTTLRVILKK